MKLEIEMIPKTSFFTNVRSVFPERWDEIRRECYKKAGYVCEICGGKGDKWPVECHEVWDYGEDTGLQKLIRLIALCPACHEVKHLGLATMKGRLEFVKAHLCKVNGISERRAQEMIDAAWILWRRRSQFRWQLDLSVLEN